MMFDETSFSIDAFAQESWLFLLDVPYFDLTGKQRVYVRSVVESVYSVAEADKIVSFASSNNLSVVDSAIALRVSTKPLQLVVAAVVSRKRDENKLPAIREPKPKNIKPARPAYAFSSVPAIHVEQDADSVIAWHAVESLVVSDDADQLLIYTGRN